MMYVQCTRCGSNLDHGEVCDCEKTLKNKVESYIGKTIPQDEWEECERHSRHKMDFQNKLFDKNNGEDYLVLLAADVYHERQMVQATQNFIQIKREVNEICNKNKPTTRADLSTKDFVASEQYDKHIFIISQIREKSIPKI